MRIDIKNGKDGIITRFFTASFRKRKDTPKCIQFVVLNRNYVL